MREIVLKEKELEKLKEYPLEKVVSTESKIYYYKKTKEWDNILLKKLYSDDQNLFERKERTIDKLQKSELSRYPELVIPEAFVTIGGIKKGFTIKEVSNSTNFHLFLQNKKIPSKKKLEMLKKIGKLLEKTQQQNQEFYFGDLQDYNFLIDNEDNIYVVDLDSSATRTDNPIITKYVVLDDKTGYFTKYKRNEIGYVYPSNDVDNYCYNTMVLNFLANTSTSCFTYEEYVEYLNYLFSIGMISREMLDIYMNHYTNKKNKSIINNIDEIPEYTGRASYSVFKQLKKQNKKYL